MVPNKILVANRGEIATRIIAAATELGLQTVAVYSDEQDRSHCLSATESVKLKSSASFLNPQHIIDAARSVNATAIHPGYGFLSESDQLAKQCKDANIVFIGPSASCITAVGDKVSARKVAEAAGIPVIPGVDKSVQNEEQILAFTRDYGFPVMLKARDGGGGRGIRMVNTIQEIPEALKRCKNESPSKQVFVEKVITHAKHIEVQILGDQHGNIIHLFERDCSLQRRYQKILEVAPCPCLSKELAAKIHHAALQIARHINYDSAGTVEFLVQPDTNEFYFLEVNPRIQVEHTISEQITHVDIVQAQIRLALGETLQTLGLDQQLIQPANLVSIQARLVAENPLNGNMLSVGKITNVNFPLGHGIRVDTWIQAGCVVLPSFDSLLAKIIVTGQSYEDALSKLCVALQNTLIEGVETNKEFLLAILNNRAFLGDKLSLVHTKSLEDNMESLINTTIARSHLSEAKTLGRSTEMQRATLHSTSPQASASIGSIQFKPGDAFNVEVRDSSNESVNHSFCIQSVSKNNFPDEFAGQVTTTIPSMSTPVSISIMRKTAFGGTGKLYRKANARLAATEIGSPVTGMIVEINVQKGDIVEAGEQLFVVSAMKMETVVRTVAAGIVKSINFSTNDLVEAGDLIVELVKDKSKL